MLFPRALHSPPFIYIHLNTSDAPSSHTSCLPSVSDTHTHFIVQFFSVFPRISGTSIPHASRVSLSSFFFSPSLVCILSLAGHLSHSLRPYFYHIFFPNIFPIHQSSLFPLRLLRRSPSHSPPSPCFLL